MILFCLLFFYFCLLALFFFLSFKDSVQGLLLQFWWWNRILCSKQNSTKFSFCLGTNFSGSYCVSKLVKITLSHASPAQPCSRDVQSPHPPLPLPRSSQYPTRVGRDVTSVIRVEGMSHGRSVSTTSHCSGPCYEPNFDPVNKGWIGR